MLQLEDVALEEPLELVVLEAVPVEEEAREAHLAVPAHRLHAVVHRARCRSLPRQQKWFFGGRLKISQVGLFLHCQRISHDAGVARAVSAEEVAAAVAGAVSDAAVVEVILFSGEEISGLLSVYQGPSERGRQDDHS